MTFDDKNKHVISNLIEAFNITDYQSTTRPIICPYTIGIEIEVKFRYLFPVIFNKWFSNGKKYHDYSLDEKLILDKEINLEENNILPKLLKVVDCGIPRGLDKYWEFSFNPSNNLSLIIDQINILRQLNLIPDGDHSIHITVGGLKPNKDVYWLLAYLELLFISKERIEEGFSKIYTKSSDTWAKKGYGGICVKNENDLINNDIGFEYRTLIVNENTDIVSLFTILNKYLTMIYENKHIDLFDKIIDEYEKVDLPNKNWQKPHMESEIWRRFINNFDTLKEKIKTL